MIMTIKTHFLRIFGWELTKVQPLPAEATKLEDAGVTNDVLQSYLAWRHSMLLVSLLALLVSVIWDWIKFANEIQSLKGIIGFTVWGKVLLSLPSFASTVLFIAVVLALCGWSQWRKSALILKFGWTISFVLAFIPALFPLEFFIDHQVYIGKTTEEIVVAVGAIDLETRAYIERVLDVVYDGLKITLAISYAIDLFPVLVTLPSGLANASIKIRGLLPEAIVSSWILILTAPFYSIIYLMALILLIQVSGNIFLLIGACLLFCAPWIYVFRRRLYIHAPTEETEQKLGRAQMAIGLIIKLGYVFLLIWVFTGEFPIPGFDNTGNLTLVKTPVKEGIVTISNVFNFILGFFGRKLATTVVFSDVLFRMTVTNWRQDKSRRVEDNGEHIDELFESIESSIHRAGVSENDEENGKEEKASKQVNDSFDDIDF